MAAIGLALFSECRRSRSVPDGHTKVSLTWLNTYRVKGDCWYGSTGRLWPDLTGSFVPRETTYADVVVLLRYCPSQLGLTKPLGRLP